MKWLLLALASLAGCTTAGNYAAMNGFVGMSIGRVIMHNGQPESRVRLSPNRVAYTFHKKNQWITGQGGYIDTHTAECRFTFIVAEEGQASDQSKVVGVQDPGRPCR